MNDKVLMESDLANVSNHARVGFGHIDGEFTVIRRERLPHGGHIGWKLVDDDGNEYTICERSGRIEWSDESEDTAVVRATSGMLPADELTVEIINNDVGEDRIRELLTKMPSSIY